MQQKVIAVNINSAAVKTGRIFEEMEFPLLNKYLAEGFKLVDTLQTDTRKDSFHFSTITFVLEKI